MVYSFWRHFNAHLTLKRHSLIALSEITIHNLEKKHFIEKSRLVIQDDLPSD